MAWYNHLLPENFAQGAKMVLQTSADVVSFAPPPFHLIGTGLEACAYGAGLCDPTSTRAAETAEFAIRAPISLIPMSGIAKVAAKAAILVTKDGGSFIANYEINKNAGKFGEISVAEAKDMFEKAYGAQISNDPAVKQTQLESFFKKMDEKGLHVIDENHKRLTPDQFAKQVIELDAKTITTAEIKASVEEHYRHDHNLVPASQLSAADDSAIKEIAKKSKEILELKGLVVKESGDLSRPSIDQQTTSIGR